MSIDYKKYSCSQLGYLLEEMVRRNYDDIQEDARELILTGAIGLFNHDIVVTEHYNMGQSLLFLSKMNKELEEKLQDAEIRSQINDL